MQYMQLRPNSRPIGDTDWGGGWFTDKATNSVFDHNIVGAHWEPVLW